MAEKPHWVYFLRCPDTHQVMYVGCTCNVKKRSNGHLSQVNDKTRKSEWVKSLRSQGKRFLMEAVIGPIAKIQAYRAESILIRRHSEAYQRNLNATPKSYEVESRQIGESISESFSRALRLAVSSGRFTVVQIAKESGVSRQHVYQMLDRKCNPTWGAASSVLSSIGCELKVTEA